MRTYLILVKPIGCEQLLRGSSSLRRDRERTLATQKCKAGRQITADSRRDLLPYKILCGWR